MCLNSYFKLDILPFIRHFFPSRQFIRNFRHLNNSVNYLLKRFRRSESKLDTQITHIKIDSDPNFELNIPSFDQHFSSPRQFNRHFLPLQHSVDIFCH